MKAQHGRDDATVSGTNTYFGATTINAGILQAGASNVFSPNSVVTINSTGRLDLNGFTNTIGGLTDSSTSSLVNLGSGTLIDNAGSNYTFAGVISGTGGLTLAGTAELFLTNSNTYTGGTSIGSGSTLSVGNGSALGSIK